MGEPTRAELLELLADAYFALQGEVKLRLKDAMARLDAALSPARPEGNTTLIANMGKIEGWEECPSCGGSWQKGGPQTHWNDCEAINPREKP